MSDENLDIMKLESSISGDKPATAADITKPRYADTKYGFTTQEEAELFSSIAESTDSLNNNVGTAGPQEKYRNYNSVADIPPQLRGIVKPENEERIDKDEEWLPNAKVYFNYEEVHGKKKNRTLIFFVVAVFVVVALIIAGFIFAE